jgi:hypothetical protein
MVRPSRFVKIRAIRVKAFRNLNFGFRFFLLCVLCVLCGKIIPDAPLLFRISSFVIRICLSAH